MTTTRIQRGLIGGVQVALALLWLSTASAQTFSSGSTGADGAFAPTATTTVALPPDGVLNFTTVTIPTGVTVSFTPNSANTPVTILATGDVTVAGVLSVNGINGAEASTFGPVVNAGGAGGPGGFAGGNGGARGGASAPSAGQGPGGGAAQNGSAANGAYGVAASIVPILGGSGGGGVPGGVHPNGIYSGASGGGGAGALVIASSSRIVVTGAIVANGGQGGANNISGCGGAGGSGSGGAIRLVATQITGAGTIQALGAGAGSCIGGAGSGWIRLEAFSVTFSGSSVPTAAVSFAPGPVSATSTPAVVTVPTLKISAVGGVAAPTSPSGAYTTADVALPPGTTNPVPVALAATNIPVGTVFTVRLIPVAGGATAVSSSPSTGTFSNATATASVTFPSGQVSVLNAFSSFTLPAQVAGLFPLIDGEPVERVMVAAAYGEPSTVTLITRSGKEIPAEQVLQGAR